jgi:hypothetical protein
MRGGAVAVSESSFFFRAVNERIRELGSARPGEMFEFVCECPQADCFASVSLTAAEFEIARSRGALAVLPGHEGAGAVLVRTSRYSLVDKSDL